MALILAVDPDQRQHAALACLARELDGHELLSASSCADALAALDRRSPDLVLLPILLPEAEESELLTRLRDQAGAEVRALTIPQLKLPDAAPVAPASSSQPAWLAQILHPQDTSDQPGEDCEPAVFADLIRSYLGPVQEAAVAVTDAARAVVEQRRARLMAAAQATVTWVRSRRERWSDRPPAVAINAPPLEVAIPIPPPPPAPVAVQAPAPAPVAVTPAPVAPSFAAAARYNDAPVSPSSEPHTLPSEFTKSDLTPFEYREPAAEVEPVETYEPYVEEEKGPGLGERVSTLFGKLKSIEKPEALDSLGPALMRWLPKVAIVAVLLTLGVTGRAYWRKASSAPRVGVAVLESLPAGSQVLVDGQVMGLTPVTATLPTGTHRVDFKYRGKTRTIDVMVTSGGKTSELVDWSPKTVGRLQVNTEPAGAHVLVDNVARGVTPLTLDDVALGSHTVVLQSPAGSVKRSVTIKSDEPVTLNETIYAGWIKVFAPFDITISEGSKVLHADDRDQVMLPAGPHEIRFQNRAFGYQETRHVEVQPGVTTPLSIVAGQSTLTLTTSAPAEVFIDGVSAGQAPLKEYPIQLGTRDILLKSPAGDKRLSVSATVKPVVMDVDMAKP